MTLLQYGDDLVPRSCKFANVYDEETLIDVFVEGVDKSICHCLRHQRALKPPADSTDISSRPEAFLSIQQEAASVPNSK